MVILKISFKKVSIVLLSLFILILISGYILVHSVKQNTSASWTYEKMITLNRINYVVTLEQIKKVDSNIGEVQHYSTSEKDFNSDNFSNYYKDGTKLYLIPNVTIKDAIAVEVEKNQFYKAVNIEGYNK